MTAAPWSTDRPLGPELAARLIEAQCPELAPVTAESMAEGWDFEAFTVNREWIFRFPKRAAVAPFLESELRLLEALPELPLQVPRYRWRGSPTEEFPYPFAGYRRIEGTDALYMDARELGEQDVRNLGAFLTALHAFPVEPAVEFGLPGDVRPTCTMSGMFQRAKDRLLSVVGAAPRELADRCAAFVHDEAGVPDERREPPVPVHNDIWEEHIIVSAEAPHGIVGVIDWSDAAVGDPAIDLAGLCHWGGDPLVDAVLEHYGAPVDAGLRRRVRFVTVCLCFIDVDCGVRWRGDAYTRMGLDALQRVFAGSGA